MIVGIDCRLIDKRQNTGISRYTEFLLNYYKNKVEVNKIIIITNNDDLKYEDQITSRTNLRPFNLLHFALFKSHVEKLQIDILHSPFYSSFLIKPKGLVSIVTVHDLMYKIVPTFFSSGRILSKLKELYFDFIVKYSIGNADIIVSVSETTQTDVYRFFKKESILIPEDSEVKGENKTDVLDNFSLEKNSYFLYCGNNRPHKNVEFVRQIFETSKDLPPLVLAGRDHHGGRNIIAVGTITDEELECLYKGAISFIFPSLYEGFGLPILEAIKLGTKVIASNISAFLEFKSKNIYFFELDNRASLEILLNEIRNKPFVPDEAFLELYSKDNIYRLNDQMLASLKFCTDEIIHCD
jgi:glycosyltransferase involved in cell wall biosynthesis